MPANKTSLDKLFVYGTLRQGCDPHQFLRATDFLGKGCIGGRLYDLGEYPGAFPSNDPADLIRGELYQLQNAGAVLDVLDEFEDCDPKHPDDSLFVRRPTDVCLENGSRCTAWVYFLPRKPQKARLIPGGDYLEARSA